MSRGNICGLKTCGKPEFPVSHGDQGTGNDHSPPEWQRTIASVVASGILAVGQVVYSVFRFVFSILLSVT